MPVSAPINIWDQAARRFCHSRLQHAGLETLGLTKHQAIPSQDDGTPFLRRASVTRRAIHDRCVPRLSNPRSSRPKGWQKAPECTCNASETRSECAQVSSPITELNRCRMRDAGRTDLPSRQPSDCRLQFPQRCIEGGSLPCPGFLMHDVGRRHGLSAHQAGRQASGLPGKPPRSSKQPA